jgi:hypothetical protein
MMVPIDPANTTDAMLPLRSVAASRMTTSAFM